MRIYLPPDTNCLLSTADHCLKSTGYVNVIVSDKQKHLQYLNMEDAVKHCTKGLGIWDWASNDELSDPDIVMASCGDVTTMESLAATAIRAEFPKLKVRFVNIVDLTKLMSASEHPHGMTDAEFDSIFTPDKDVIMNFHGYPLADTQTKSIERGPIRKEYTFVDIRRRGTSIHHWSWQ